jgi:hypothetical protein
VRQLLVAHSSEPISYFIIPINFPRLARRGKDGSLKEQRFYCDVTDVRIDTKDAPIVSQEVSEWLPEMSSSSCQDESVFLLCLVSFLSCLSSCGP